MYKEKILNMLRSSRTSFLSGEELGRKAGISRTMVCPPAGVKGIACSVTQPAKFRHVHVANASGLQ